MVKTCCPQEDFLPREAGAPVQWTVSAAPVAYPDALAAMEARVAAIQAGKAGEMIWLLEHPPLYTAGTSAKPADLLEPERFPVYPVGRGGQYTYHGPGQRVVYVMLDLARRQKDVRLFVATLERWIVDALAILGVTGETRAGRTGIWVARPETGPDAADKIAAIGLRVRHWVSFHGISINVAPDLSHYRGIVACGIHDSGVTSLADLGHSSIMSDLDAALVATFSRHFGPMEDIGTEAADVPDRNSASPFAHNSPPA